MKCAAIFLLLLAAGCGRPWVGDETPRAGQAAAVTIVWSGSYGMPGDAPPILWRTEHGCDDMAAWLEDGSCVAGIFVENHVEVAADVGTPFSDTSFAHELCHAFKQATTGDSDTQHLSDCFGPHGRSLAAQSALRAAGL